MSFVLNSTKAILIGHRVMGEALDSRVLQSLACAHCVTVRASLVRQAVVALGVQ